jgi:glycosyltransferase involved in cell wall biosynthesis
MAVHGRDRVLEEHTERTNVFSVIVPTVGRARLIDLALSSLNHQEYREFEVVIVNDGGETILPTIRRWKSKFPIELVELPLRRGASYARNCAVDVSQGVYLAFLDDDDIFLPSHLTRLCEMLDRGSQVAHMGAVVSDRRLDPAADQLSGLHRKTYDFDQSILYAANYLHTGSVGCLNFRDTDVRFDNEMDHCEDWDLWLALTDRLGFRLTTSKEISAVYHQIPGNSGQVARAQADVPTAFSIVRQRIYSKWHSDSPLVGIYRSWLSEFEEVRNRCLSKGMVMPTQLFDTVLHYLNICYVEGKYPLRARIEGLITEPMPPRDTRRADT